MASIRRDFQAWPTRLVPGPPIRRSTADVDAGLGGASTLRSVSRCLMPSSSHRARAPTPRPLPSARRSEWRARRSLFQLDPFQSGAASRPFGKGKASFSF
jgi:hypothetical protein